MDLLDFIVHFIINILIGIFSVSCWLKFSNIKKSGISKLIIILLSALSITLTSQFFPNPIKIVIIFLLLIAINYFFINQKIKLSVISVTISQLILAIAEFSFAIIVSFFYDGDIQNFTQHGIVFFILNLYIIVVSFLILKSHYALKIYKILAQTSIGKNNTNETLVYVIMIIIVAIISTAESYMNLPTMLVLITNTLMASIFIAIIITSSSLKANYEKINSKYETSISSLKEYEVMIDKFRVDTHENKNEFLTIRNMIKDNNDKNTVVKYIDKLVDNKIKDNDKIMKKTAKIPEGGLRATIYSKLCLMDKLKIKYNLNISREVRTTDLINLDEDLVLKICKILGVFLDNAIEAVKKLKKKEISIEMYTLEDSLCIDITNNFKGNLDLDKISNAKYTTKGDGHGYGLTLVNNILSEEPNRLENEKSINRDTFTQTLKIKM